MIVEEIKETDQIVTKDTTVFNLVSGGPITPLSCTVEASGISLHTLALGIWGS